MAILHTLLNLENTVQVGDTISGLRGFFAEIPADIRGQSIAQMDNLLTINNNYDFHHPVLIEELKMDKEVCLYLLLISIILSLIE